MWDVNFKHAPHEKVHFKMFSDDKLKFYVLHFSVWEDLWPYSNAYVRPGTRAKTHAIYRRKELYHFTKSRQHSLCRSKKLSEIIKQWQ